MRSNRCDCRRDGIVRGGIWTHLTAGRVRLQDLRRQLDGRTTQRRVCFDEKQYLFQRNALPKGSSPGESLTAPSRRQTKSAAIFRGLVCGGISERYFSVQEISDLCIPIADCAPAPSSLWRCSPFHRCLRTSLRYWAETRINGNLQATGIPEETLLQFRNGRGFTASGPSVSICDFTRQEITLLDHDRKRYAVVGFRQMADELEKVSATSGAVESHHGANQVSCGNESDRRRRHHSRSRG